MGYKNLSEGEFSSAVKRAMAKSKTFQELLEATTDHPQEGILVLLTLVAVNTLVGRAPDLTLEESAEKCAQMIVLIQKMCMESAELRGMKI